MDLKQLKFFKNKKRQNNQQEEMVNKNKETKYSINRSKIFEKEAEALPTLMWFYTFNKETNQLLNICLAKEDKNLYHHKWAEGNRVFSDIKNEHVYVLCPNDMIAIFCRYNGICEIAQDSFRDILNDGKTYCHSFVDNCLNQDVYVYEDFYEIYRLVLKEIYDKIDYMNKDELTVENVKNMIDDIHREYMISKGGLSEEIQNRFKVHKTLAYLKNNKFTIDNKAILKGNLKMLPVIKWVFIQSKNNPHVFQIDLGIRYKENFDFIQENPTDYCASLIKDGYYKIKDDNSLACFSFYDFIEDENEKWVLDFVENVLYTDVYNLEDLKNIVGCVSDKINHLLVNDENKDNINYVEPQLSAKMLTNGEVKKMIKKAHREYMDNKKYNG